MSTVYFTHVRVAGQLVGNAMATLEGVAMEGGRGAPDGSHPFVPRHLS